MPDNEPSAIAWLAAPEDHDYPAAASYLQLTYSVAAVNRFIEALKAAPMSTFAAKDIFRASQLPQLPPSNGHVDKDARKIAAGARLSPLLLVRDEAHGKLVIADGYHRLCAVYARDEDASIPCKLV